MHYVCSLLKFAFAGLDTLPLDHCTHHLYADDTQVYTRYGLLCSDGCEMLHLV